MKIERLELIHLVNYLPYKISPLKVKWYDGIYTLDGLTGAWNVDIRQAMRVTHNVHIETIKPILRPILDLEKQINGIDIWKELSFSEYSNKTYSISQIVLNRIFSNTLKFSDATVLFKYLFDVYGLIDEGLAIDINTL